MIPIASSVVTELINFVCYLSVYSNQSTTKKKETITEQITSS